MLMNRYLHCTTHQQKTWMTAGLAMRIAQTMCCNSLETPAGKDTGNDVHLKRKVWASCVALDRYVLIHSTEAQEMSLTVVDAFPGHSERHLRWRLFHRRQAAVSRKARIRSTLVGSWNFTK
jgi:hypothetical protein